MVATIWSFSQSFYQSSAATCLDQIRVSGPGWDDPTLILPSRYFFIEYPEDCPDRIHKIIVTSPNGYKDCPSRIQMLNETLHGNHLAIVRYKLFTQVCKNGISISLLDQKGNEVKKKLVQVPIYDEVCSCQSEDFWHRMKCDSNSEMYQQIQDDLR